MCATRQLTRRRTPGEPRRLTRDYLDLFDTMQRFLDIAFRRQWVVYLILTTYLSRQHSLHLCLDNFYMGCRVPFMDHDLGSSSPLSCPSTRSQQRERLSARS